MKKFLAITLVLAMIISFALALTGCPPTAPPEEVVEETTEEPTTTEEEPPPPVEKTIVEFWTTDNEEYRVDVQEAIATKFMEANPDIEVRVIPIDEASIAQRISTAKGANRLPDVVRMGVERVAPFYADGLLDAEAATAVINNLGADTFFKGPLNWVTVEEGYGAVPFDGWLQAIWYRADAFDELGLEPPESWDQMKTACESLAGYSDFLYGITLATDPGQNYGMQVFEQYAMSNGAFPFNDAGNVTMNTPEMIEALTFYAGLADCAAPGPNYWKQAREYYITGQSAMLFYSSYVMDDLAGLQEGVEPTVAELASKTGFASRMVGASGDEATYGQLVTLGIFEGTDTEATSKWVEYLLTDGYLDILNIAPNGKMPVRTTAVEEWKKHEIFKQYPAEVLDTIVKGFDTAQRWLFAPQMGSLERAVIGDIEGRLLIPTALSNIILEKTMTPKQAAKWLQTVVEEIKAEREAEAEG